MGFIPKQLQSYGANSQGKAYIKFHFECDSQSDLPTQTQFETSDNLIIAMGSTAHTIADNKRWEMNSTGTWVDVTSSSGGGGGSYTLPPATTSTLGGIIVGSGLTVAQDGTLSAGLNFPKITNSIITYAGTKTTGIHFAYHESNEGSDKPVNGHRFTYVIFVQPNSTQILALDGQTYASPSIYVCNKIGSNWGPWAKCYLTV